MRAPRLSAAVTAIAATSMVLNPNSFQQRSDTPDQTPTPRHRDPAILPQQTRPDITQPPAARPKKTHQLQDATGTGKELTRTGSPGIRPNYLDPQIRDFQNIHRNGALRTANIGSETEEPISSDTMQSTEDVKDSFSLIDKITARVLRRIGTRLHKHHDARTRTRLADEEVQKHLRRKVGQLPADEWTLEQLQLADERGLNDIREDIADAVSFAIRRAKSENQAEKRSYRLRDQIRGIAQKRQQRNFLQEQPESAPEEITSSEYLSEPTSAVVMPNGLIEARPEETEILEMRWRNWLKMKEMGNEMKIRAAQLNSGKIIKAELEADLV